MCPAWACSKAVWVPTAGLPTADRGEIIIVDARLTELDVAGLPKRYSKALSKVAARVAQRHFAEVPVYRLDHNDFKESLARLVLKSVEVRDGEVVATIGL